ncbi:MAG: tRNA epoxyqueuosine(34) reductase QueG [Bacteroidaceae bacterium]|nr:tRNA epoxyqueuosine(34) reductase QueG [Bacteroidaceae bacterium]
MEAFIKSKARQLGFSACGIAKAEAVDKDVQQHYQNWIKGQHHGEMGYLERNIDKRFDPTLLVPGCKSLIVCALNYYPSEPLEGNYRIAYYAYGKDYHKVLKDKLYQLAQAMETQLGENPTLAQRNSPEGKSFKPRALVDSAPILERYWAQKASLGWIGRNKQLIIPGAGSYFFLGILATDLELQADTPYPNRCGNCKACINACPTGALSEIFDARRCISYLTIEQKSPIPSDFSTFFEHRIYGCDSCQTACPWNRFAKATTEKDFFPNDKLRGMTDADWDNLTQQQFDELFSESAVERAGYEGLKRNIEAVKE